MGAFKIGHFHTLHNIDHYLFSQSAHAHKVY